MSQLVAMLQMIVIDELGQFAWEPYDDIFIVFA